MLLVTADEMQDMDQKTIRSFGIPGLVLMESAGRGAVDALLSKINTKDIKNIAVMAGRGNNGGDGFVMARYLMEKGFKVTAFLLASKEAVKGDARVNMQFFETLCGHSSFSSLVEIKNEGELKTNKTRILHHDLFIDAILGTGLNAELKGVVKDAVELMNKSGKPVFSVDIPSGLNADTGKPLGSAVKAFATAAFAFAKAGHILYPGNIHTGELSIIDIGIPKFIADEKKIQLRLVEKQDIAAFFPPREFDSHKGSFGHVLVIAGSTGKTGAAAFCADAAMRCGTGLVTLGIPESLNPVMESLVLEPMTHPLPEKETGFLSETCLKDILGLLKGKQALALGPGLGTREGTKKLVQELIEQSPVPLVLDADAVNCIAENPGILKKKTQPAILTPHPGEMARLCNLTTRDIWEDRIGIARKFASEFEVILVLKGAQTVIALPDGKAFINPTGNPGMASGGMGDVLTGMTAGFLAQGFSPENASLAGVYIHGLCADILSKKMGNFGFLAKDMINAIPKTIFQHIL
ncbi:MAG: bifunctional ADP-dependent (S)-NAD(P)H-hydrate dehydratase/NAD(P)H-hydrate epimerase [Desulfobacterales bacterium RIFOXYA12_FULL_46_15]|nr:MAG: bifunctional ADP-dependent (S)-NAD(P)H-hydrate dehydratase/NAD(P)H-hydrate epimerase [Desulfobacterales bacterium RIFOXYA12_FULL_46_15]